MNYIYKRILTSITLLLVVYLCIKNSYVLFVSILLLSFISINEFSRLFKNIFKQNLSLIFFSNILSIIYLSLFSIIIWFYLSSSQDIKIMTLIFLLIICILTDIGGFIFGKLIGGKKLTKISPNKTYSGMFGSFIFSLLFGYFFYHYQLNILTLNINIFIFIFIISFISQLGDLMISFLKRKAKLKDTGSVLPGHGGILDRIDGILFAIPVGILLISI
jgi:phosphatidate cytidylyltransferase